MNFQKKVWCLQLLFIIFLLWVVIPIGILIIEREENTTNEIEATTTVAPTPIPAPTNTPTPTPIPLPTFVVDYELVYNPDITIAEKEENTSMADSLIFSLEPRDYENSQEVELEIQRLKTVRDSYLKDLTEWKHKVEEYPTACEIWLFLTEEMELEDIQAAAIIGNMMVEAGGHSLYIDTAAYSSGFYGVCQWSTSYHWRVNNLDLRGQLEYLRDTIEDEFRYGSASYSQFINATNVRDASVYFAKGYERCADPYRRQNTAERAYEYFCGEGSER